MTWNLHHKFMVNVEAWTWSGFGCHASCRRCWRWHGPNWVGMCYSKKNRQRGKRTNKQMQNFHSGDVWRLWHCYTIEHLHVMNDLLDQNVGRAAALEYNWSGRNETCIDMCHLSNFARCCRGFCQGMLTKLSNFSFWTCYTSAQDLDPAYISPKIRQRLGVPLEAWNPRNSTPNLENLACLGSYMPTWSWVSRQVMHLTHFPNCEPILLGGLGTQNLYILDLYPWCLLGRWSCRNRCKR